MELVEVDDWAPEEVVVLVEVSHTDCEAHTSSDIVQYSSYFRQRLPTLSEVTQMVLIEICSVVMLTTSLSDEMVMN